MNESDVLGRVRRALGRGNDPTPTPPAPPAIDEKVARLVHSGADLVDYFAKAAKEQKMRVTRTSAGELGAVTVAFMREFPIKRVALAASERLTRFGIADALRRAGFEVRSWDEMTLDEMYDFDCAVTDVDCAVAENATLVVRPSGQQGRSVSLVPMYHVAVVEASQIMPDMIDLFEKLSHDPNHSNVILITGPSKTADIEMNVVTGVHGPNVVQIMLI